MYSYMHTPDASQSVMNALVFVSTAFGASRDKVVLGDLLVRGLESAFRGYFPPFKYRSSDDRDLRGFVGSVRSDEGLASLAGGGRQAEELARLDGALVALDTPSTESSHYTWEDFLVLLGQRLGGAVYKKGVGFVQPEEDYGKSLSERMLSHFDQGSLLDQLDNVGGTREALLRHLNEVTTSGEYENSSKSAIEQTPGVSAVEAGAKTEAAMEVDIHEEVGEDSAEGMRRITDRITAVEQELAQLKMGTSSSSGPARPEQPSISLTSASTASTLEMDSTATPRSWGRSALEVSKAVEERMAAKEKAQKARKANTFLRKGRLTPEQEEEVDWAFDGGAGSEILVKAFNADLSRRDLRCLKPYTWLNDEVVNMYMELLAVRDKELCKKDPTRRMSHFFSSFFLTKLKGNGNYNYGGVRRWTRKVKVFEMDKIFCPVNVSNTHWCMAVIYVQKKRINYYDSMGGGGKTVTNSLLLWLEDEDEDKNKDEATFDPDEWTTVGTKVSTTPQQQNGSDCGAFAISFASYLSDDLPFDFSQADITQMRRRMLWSLLKQRLV
eukprot:jgi/Undpi1/4501/HiC_scaffold_17.g07855.m1